jgi:hypothetical protein
MPVVVLHAFLNFPHGLIDQAESIDAMSTFVGARLLKMLLRFSQCLHGGIHIGLIFSTATAASFPATAPATSAPIAASPTTELGAIDDAAFTVFKHALASIRTSGVDAQGLDATWIRVNAEGTVTHSELAVGSCEFLQTVGDVHVTLAGSVLGAQDHVLPVITTGILRKADSGQQGQ